MVVLSLLRRFALLAPALVTFAQLSHASAQLPVFGPLELEPTPAPEAPPVAESAAPEIAPAPVSPVPPTPPRTPQPARQHAPGAARSPDQPSAPSPAKTDHIAEQTAIDDLDAELEEDDAEYDEAGERRRRWYGWQTLIVDGCAVGLLLTAAAIEGSGGNGDTDVLVATALLGYEFAPGIIHFTHRNTGRGFASFGLRLGMPLAGAFLGAATSSGCDEFLCEAQGAAIGTLLGVAGAMAIDAAVFAYEDTRPRRLEARLVPVLGISQREAWLGIGGQL
jgi:hypothetical protein